VAEIGKYSIKVYFETIGEFLETYGPRIQEGGMEILLTQRLSVGDLVKLEFRLKSEYPILEGTGIIRSVSEKGKGFLVFVAFQELDEKSRKIIEEALRLYRPKKEEEVLEVTGEEVEEVVEEGGKEEVKEVVEESFDLPELEGGFSEEKKEVEEILFPEETLPEERKVEEAKRRKVPVPLLWVLPAVVLAGVGIMVFFFFFRSSSPPSSPSPVSSPIPTARVEEPTSPPLPVSPPSSSVSPPVPVSPPSPPPIPSPPPRVSLKVSTKARHLTSVEFYKGGVLLTFDGDPPSPKTFVLSSPSRFVVDLFGIKSKLPVRNGKLKVSGSSPYVEQIRIGDHGEKIRIVFDLKKEKKFSVKKEGETLYFLP
jgi:hypothetical protein